MENRMVGMPDRDSALVLMVLSLVGGCELDLTTRLDQNPQVASVALMSEASEEPTRVVIPPGGPSRVRVQVLDDEGRAIPSFGPGHYTSLLWKPAGWATSAAVAGEPFSHDVFVPKACQPPQVAYVGIGHDPRADEKFYGPVPVEVLVGAASARAFAPDGVELTPAVRLPAREPFNIEVRFYDCGEQQLTGLEAESEVLVFFHSDSFAEWVALPGGGFRVEVTINADAGARGQIGFGFRKVSAEAYQFFGPFPLEVF